MKLSVLVASRGRVEGLKRSLASFGWEKGRTLPNIEFLIAVDSDDPQIKDYKREFDGLTIIECPRFGYGDLHKYYNKLAKLSVGDWLLNWNDDATITLGDWMGELDKADHTQPYTAQPAGYSPFPLMSRKLYEIVGHFSEGALIDRYLLGLGEKSGRHIYIGGSVKIDHDRVDDQTKRDGDFTLGMASEHDGLTEQLAAAEKVKLWLGEHSD
jgi:hypothetical protein